MEILAVANQKGGVGKTTVVLGLAARASARGERVLVVDLDPQANATSGLAVWDPALTVDHALAADRPGAIASVIGPAGWGPAVGLGAVPSVAPASPSLAGREPQLANDPVGAQDRLAIALDGLDFDLVLIDCPPSLGLLTVNGLFAAHRALVVTEPGAWAVDGVDQMLQTIARVGQRRGRPLPVAGIVVNRLGRTRDNKYWYEQVREAYPLLVRSPIQLRAAVAEASAQSMPIHALAGRAGAVEAMEQFDLLLDELLEPADAGL